MLTVERVATADVVAGMLTENTGGSLLDSGGFYGRNWERNQGLTVADFQGAPRAVLDGDTVTVSVFHHMVENLDYNQAWDAQLSAFIDSSDYGYYEGVRAWLDSIGVENDYFSERVVQSWNTYEVDGDLLSQTLQGWTVTFPDGITRTIVQVHGGCDVRGGYTRPRVFDVFDEYWWLCNSWTVQCDGVAELDGQLDISGEVASPMVHTFSVGSDAELNLWEHVESLRGSGVKLDYVPCPDCGAVLRVA
jgi:hypothetical protein